jgi:hypothetical protein
VPAGTDVVLRHELLPEDDVDSHEDGWNWMLDRLAGLLGRRPS